MTPISSSIDRQRGKYVPWVMVAFFLIFMIPLVGFTIIAFTHRPSEVTEHAYEKGLSYNRTLEKAQAQDALGWQSDIALAGNTVRFTLKDKSGNPISGATVSGWLVRPTEAALDRPFLLKEAAAGRYEAGVDWPAKGLWNIRVTAIYEGTEFQADKTLMVQ